jgi:peptidoglycan biosynthesis protein MviN/MurJ (putative lipid II flippase)
MGLIFNPLAIIFYIRKKVKILILIQSIQIILIVSLNYFLIPNYGAMAVAFISSFVKIIGYIMFLYYVIQFEKDENEKVL